MDVDVDVDPEFHAGVGMALAQLQLSKIGEWSQRQLLTRQNPRLFFLLLHFDFSAACRCAGLGCWCAGL